jgi:uncharacterized membrane protein HdeD (DUF308 family)
MESSLNPAARDALRGVSGLWWLWVVFGVAWIAISVVILQFDQASVTTVGVLIGLMFLATAAQQMAIGAFVGRFAWVYYLFSFLFLVAGVISLISPENTFAAIADVLGFLFLIVGIFWIIQAFMERDVYDLWWIGLIAGILMLVVAFWTGGQFFIHKQYILLAFAGIWALLHGVTDLMRAFYIRQLGKLV